MKIKIKIGDIIFIAQKQEVSTFPKIISVIQ